MNSCFKCSFDHYCKYSVIRNINAYLVTLWLITSILQYICGLGFSTETASNRLLMNTTWDLVQSGHVGPLEGSRVPRRIKNPLMNVLHETFMFSMGFSTRGCKILKYIMRHRSIRGWIINWILLKKLNPLKSIYVALKMYYAIFIYTIDGKAATINRFVNWQKINLLLFW